MLCSCIVTKLKNTFDSLVCEFTANVVKGGIVSRCRCNIFTIGNRSTRSSFFFSASSLRKFLAYSPLNLVIAEYETVRRVTSLWSSGLSRRDCYSRVTVRIATCKNARVG